MAVTVAISFKHVFLNDENVFEKEPVESHKLP